MIGLLDEVGYCDILPVLGWNPNPPIVTSQITGIIGMSFHTTSPNEILRCLIEVKWEHLRYTKKH
jgi:hypothetical protein